MSIYMLIFLLFFLGIITSIILYGLDVSYKKRFIIMMIFISIAVITSLVDHYFNKRQEIIIITNLGLCLEQDNKTGLKEIKQCNRYEDVYYLGNNVMLRNIK